mmetsp:Transcript_37804/g.103909  ORF Transcript_37804/g.103909 Transcript_37804/m.103909 type:complete len:222 (+) Transcript_37804:135-800(+)
MLHQASLQVPGPRGLNGGVHKPLSSCHAVEEKLLWPDPSQKTISDVAAGAAVEVVGRETRQRSACSRQWGLPALELLLAKAACHLGLVHLGALRSCLHHGRETIPWECQAGARWEARIHHLSPVVFHLGEHHSFQVVSGLALLLQYLPRGLLHLSRRALDAPWSRRAVLLQPLAERVFGCASRLDDPVCAIDFHVVPQHEVAKGARKAMQLQVSGEKPRHR